VVLFARLNILLSFTVWSRSYMPRPLKKTHCLLILRTVCSLSLILTGCVLTSRPIYYTHSFVLTPTGQRWSHSVKFNNSYCPPPSITSWGNPRNYTRNRTVVCGTHFTQSEDYINWHVDGRHDIFLLLLLLWVIPIFSTLSNV
jgi:hypothetical protein